jgi:regulator of protease activity HflC (stomatin/prohibitin superfamily)
MKELTIGSFRAVMGKVNTVTLASERDEVSDRTLANLRNVLAPYGIITDETRLLSIEFSKQFEAKIEKAAEEKAAVERAVQTARLREQEALALVTKAKGEAEAKRLAAEAEAEAYQITQVAHAEADRTRLAGEAEAERLRDRAAAIRENPQLIALLRAEAMLKWDGDLPKRMYPNSALPILNLEPGPRQ